jgi:hypothetical protein
VNPSPAERPEATPPQARRPWTLALLVGIVVAEALVLLAFAVTYAVGLVRGEAATSPGGAVFTMVLLLLVGIWLAAVALFLWRGFRWTRAAVLVVQIFALTIGVPTLTGGFPLYGLLIVVPAVVAAFLLFERRVLAATLRTGRQADRG